MKRLVTLILTFAILGLIVWKVGSAELMDNLRHTHMGWFTAAILMFVPQIVVIAWRWRMLVALFTPITMGESVALVLASNTMNLVLPSKLGDLTKGVFLWRSGSLDLKRSMNIVVFEKMLDVGALALMMLGGVGLMWVRGAEGTVERGAALVAAVLGVVAVGAVAVLYFVPLGALPGMAALMRFLASTPRLSKVHEMMLASHEVVTLLQSRGGKRWRIAGLAIVIWILHLAQIWFFFLSLGADPPFGQFASLVPLAIFIGLLPVTIGGFGTRDAALIQFFPQFPAAMMLGVALYVNIRYILPAIAGLPFLHRYLAYAKVARDGGEAAR